MVRAVLKRVRVHLLGPLPENWTEGCELVIGPAEAEAEDAPEDLDRWLDELDALGDPFEEPGEWKRFQANLADADRLAKASVRRQMGLT